MGEVNVPRCSSANPTWPIQQAQRDPAVEAQVDEAAAELWGLTDRELREIRRS